jgi:hypothetical protein
MIFPRRRTDRRRAVERGGDELAGRIAGAEAPFWAHVRDALAERHP